PQHLGRQRAGFFWRLGEFDATAFAAATGVDLCLDDNPRRAVVEQGFGRSVSFFAAFDHVPTRHGHSVFREDGFSLVLVYFHVCMMTAGRVARGPDQTGWT